MILLHFDEIAERSQQWQPCLPLTLTVRTSWDKAVFFGKTKTNILQRWRRVKGEGDGQRKKMEEKPTERLVLRIVDLFIPV